jgi:hypothetical protein
MTTQTMTTAKLTVSNLKKLDRDPKTAILRAALIATRKVAAIRRAEVDAYIQPIFDTFEFYAERSGRRLTRPDDLYLVEDLNAPEVKAFDAACTAAHRAHGYDLPDGHCPALVAHHAAVQAEKALLQHFSAALGIDFASLYGEDREKAVTLFLAGGR